MSDYQVGGSHYLEMPLQPWDAMQAWMSREQYLGYLRGNIIKYVARAGAKGAPVEDYRKAKHYLEVDRDMAAQLMSYCHD